MNLTINDQTLIDDRMDNVTQQAFQLLNQPITYLHPFYDQPKQQQQQQQSDNILNGNMLGLSIPYSINYPIRSPSELTSTSSSSIPSSTPPLVYDSILSPIDFVENLPLQQHQASSRPSTSNTTISFNQNWSKEWQERSSLSFQQIQTPLDFHPHQNQVHFDSMILKRNSMIEQQQHHHHQQHRERKKSFLFDHHNNIRRRSRLYSAPEHPYRFANPNSRSSVRDEQNRQKSKRYYERKKAQNVALQSVCIALDEWRGVYQATNLSSSPNSSTITLSERRKLNKTIQKNEELRQFQTITKSAIELEKILRLTSCSNLAKILSNYRKGVHRNHDEQQQEEDHIPLLTLEIGLSIWFDNFQFWSDLLSAEKRMDDSDLQCTEKPIQKFIALLSKIS